MKTYFETPEIQVMSFSVEDIITTSGEGEDPEDNSGYRPKM